MRFSIYYSVLTGLLIGLVVLFIHLNNKNNLSENDDTYATVRNAFTDWNECTTARLKNIRSAPEKVWWNFPAITRNCTLKTGVSKIKLARFRNKDEIKHYILSNDVSQPSVVVSIGIGADVQAEEKLKEVLPEGSEFFGADPVRAPNEALYSKVGKFFPYAISVHNGFHPSQIRLDNGLYRSTVVENVDMLTFLTAIVQREFVDHVIMDNEGPEYDIVPMMAVDNLFPDNNIVVCHMNVEFHRPTRKEEFRKFAKIMWDLLEAGRYGIIHNVNMDHIRMFLVNYDDRRCVKKYLEQFFL